MKRPFPRFEVLGLAAALAAGGACTPNNSVKPGAPVLMEMTVVEPPAPGAYGPTLTTVTAMTSSCPSNTKEGDPCVSASFPSCEMPTDNTLCRCIPNPPPPPPVDAGASDAATSDASTSDAATSSDAGSSDAARPDGGAGASDAAAPPPPADGTWNCTFASTSSVLYVFDRLLNTTPFDPQMATPDVANVTSVPANSLVSGLASYSPNGVQNGTIFPMLGFPDGPNVTVTGSPALPISSTIAVALNRTKVTAKDGTPFSGTGLLLDGTIQFKTQKTFEATIAAPPAPPMAAADAATPLNLPDSSPATITFTNPVSVDPTAPKTLVGHVIVQATAAGSTTSTDVAVDLATMDGLTVTVTPTAKPTATTWPASSHITISLDATATDAVGDLLTTPATAVSFDTSAM